jgi:UDP-glucose 6-dehydrogenase
MKIIIVGNGFVGKAVTNALKIKNEVVIVDPQYTTDEIKHHLDADGIIVCVPTPTTENGICDASILANVMDEIPIFLPVLIKSTVTPAIVEGFDAVYPDHSICYSPEFLRARSADKDFLNQKKLAVN